MHRADFVDALRQDMHFALRQFRRAPGVAFSALFTLALGIGATTAIFTLLYHVVLRPFPFAHPERVVYVAERYQGSNGNMSIGNYVDVARWYSRTPSDRRDSVVIRRSSVACFA